MADDIIEKVKKLPKKAEKLIKKLPKKAGQTLGIIKPDNPHVPATDGPQEAYTQSIRKLRGQQFAIDKLKELYPHDPTVEGDTNRRLQRDLARGINDLTVRQQDRPWYSPNFKDIYSGFGKGAHNYGISMYDLVGHGVFGLEQANQRGWRLKEDHDGWQGGLASGMGTALLGYGTSKIAGGALRRAPRLWLGPKKGVKADLALSKGGLGMHQRAWIGTWIHGLKHGAIGDFLAFHPKQGNMGNLLLAASQREDWAVTNPAFYGFMVDYAKDLGEHYGNLAAIDTQAWDDKDMRIDKQALSRFKNTGEGALLGVSAEVFIRFVKVNFVRWRVRVEEERLINDLETFSMIQKEIGETDAALASLRDNPEAAVAIEKIMKQREKLFGLYTQATKWETMLPENLELKNLQDIDGVHSGIGKTESVYDPALSTFAHWEKEVAPGTYTVDPELSGVQTRTEIDGEIFISPQAEDFRATPESFFKTLKGEVEVGGDIIWAGSIAAGKDIKGKLISINEETGRYTIEVGGKRKTVAPSRVSKIGAEEDKKVWESLLKQVDEEDLKEMISSPEKLKAFLIMRQKARGRKRITDIEDLTEREVEAMMTALGDVKWATPQIYGGILKDHTFATEKSPDKQHLLYEIDADGDGILIDHNAINHDFAEGGKLIKGIQTDPKTGSRTRASDEELTVFELLGVDPNKFMDGIHSITGGGRDAQQMYKRFFELRARHVVRIAERDGIALNTVSVRNPNTRYILTEATDRAIFNPTRRGGLGMGQVKEGVHPKYWLKSESALRVTPSGNNVDFGSVKDRLLKKNDLGEPEGLTKISKIIEDAKSGLDTEAGEELWSNLAHGDLWAWHTAGADLDSNAVMVGLSKIFASEFNSHYGSPQSLARALGADPLRAAGDAPSMAYLASNLDDTIKKMAQVADVDEEELWKVLAEGTGPLHGGELKVVPLTALEDLGYDSIRTLHARVMAMRVRIHGRSVVMGEAADDLIKLMKELNPDGTPKASPADTLAAEMAFVHAVTEQLTDLHSLSAARTSAGRTLRMFRDFDSLSKRLDPETLEEMQEEIIRGFGGSEDVRAKAQAIMDMRKETLLNPGDSLEAAIKEAELMSGASTLGVLDAVNDIWINAMLSGLRTHTINNVSSMIKGVLTEGEKLAASFLPERMFRGLKDPITHDAILASVAKGMARSQSYKQLMYTFSYSWDVMRAFLRAGDEEDFILTGKNELRRSQQQGALDAVSHISRADASPELYAIGGKGKEKGYANTGAEIIKEGSTSGGAASSKNLGASARAFARDWLGKTAAYPGLQKMQKWKSVQGAAWLWDGFYNTFIRQATRKMVTGDQTFKRIHMMASLDATLWSWAIHRRGMDPKDMDALAKWIVDTKENLILKNGQPFSKENLQMLAVEEGRKAGYTGSELRHFQNKYFADNWDLLNAAGGTEMTGALRERLATRALDEANEKVFQRPLTKDRQEVYDVQLAQSKIDDSVATPDKKSALQPPLPTPQIEEWARQNPVGRAFFPFVKTPINLWRDATSRLPFFGKFTKKHNADILSKDPTRVSQAYGRQMAGGAIMMGAVGLVASGRITGGGPLDPRERANWEKTGWKPWSIVMPNGEYWEYGRFEPYSTLFKVAADSYENWHILSGDPAREDIFLKGLQAVSTGIGYTMVDATYMKNAMEVLTLINNAIGKKDLDNFQDNTPYLKKRLAALMVPNIAEGPGAAFDSNMREIRTFGDGLQKRIFPWLLPKRRDPIFGNEVGKGFSYSTNPRIAAWTPSKMRISKKETLVRLHKENPEKYKASLAKADQIEQIYSEIVSLHSFIGPPNIYLDGNHLLKMTRHYATFEATQRDPELKANNERSILHYAKNFKAPGGALCTVKKGQDFYDFYQQYMSLRKVPWEPGEVKHWGEDLPSGMTDETKKAVKNMFDNMSNLFDAKQTHVGLQDILTAMIQSDYYDTIKHEGDPITGVSYKRHVLASLVEQWRARSLDELFGITMERGGVKDKEGNVVRSMRSFRGKVDLSLDKSQTNEDLPPLYRYRPGEEEKVKPMGFGGVASIFWPNLSMTRALKDERLYGVKPGKGIRDMPATEAAEKEQGRRNIQEERREDE